METGTSRIWVLFVAVALLSVGHGLHGSLVGVRANAEAFSTFTTGLIMSGYPAGLLASSWATPRIIQQVGHIRVFAGFASVVSTVVLLIPLWIDPAWWFTMRFIAGLCTSGLFIVCESWLNSATTSANRGKLLSIYMIVSYGAMGAGQLLLNIADQSGFSRFILVSALLSLALVPLSLVPSETPSLKGVRRVSLADIFKTSPLAVTATFLSGLAQSAFFAMGAVFGLMQGMSLPYVSFMMALPPFAVILSQMPAGFLSDKYDRRTVIMVMAIASVVIAALAIPAGSYSAEALILFMGLFGAAAFPVYSIVIAHAADQMSKEQILGASAKLVLIYGLGSMLGPTAAGYFMQTIGAAGFMTFMILCYGLIAGHALYRRTIAPASGKANASDVMQAGPVTTPIAVEAIVESKS